MSQALTLHHKPSQAVTNRHIPSEDATSPHTPSQAVTLRHKTSQAFTLCHKPSQVVTSRHKLSHSITRCHKPLDGGGKPVTYKILSLMDIIVICNTKFFWQSKMNPNINFLSCINRYYSHHGPCMHLNSQQKGDHTPTWLLFYRSQTLLFHDHCLNSFINPNMSSLPKSLNSFSISPLKNAAATFFPHNLNIMQIGVTITYSAIILCRRSKYNLLRPHTVLTMKLAIALPSLRFSGL